jgi:topoisomerase-4 subunit A
MLVFDLAEVKTQPGGGRGVTLMDVDDGERLVIALPIGRDGARLTAIKGKAERPTDIDLAGAALEAQRGHRARKGKLVDSKLKPPFRLQRIRR